MSRLQKIASKSKLNHIRLKIDNELIKFNLYEELQINENIINKEIQEQPSHSGFLSLLQVKLTRVMSDKELEMEKVEAEEYTKWKCKIDPQTNRPYSKEYAEAMATKSKRFQESAAEYHEAKENMGIVKSCVEAFNQRSFLLQSLSANIRKEH